jgi:hypothetical protein
MNIYPIKNVEAPRETEKTFSKNNKIIVTIPVTWWASDLTFEEIIPEGKKKQSLNKKNTIPLSDLKDTHKNWSTGKGDYRVHTLSSKKDYVYYRNLKEKFLSHMFYPFLFIGMYIIYIVLHYISKF